MIEPEAELGALARRLASERRTVQPSADAAVYQELFQRYQGAFDPAAGSAE